MEQMSKYLWVVPLKTLQSDETAMAFEEIIKKTRRCLRIVHVDGGFEYAGASFQSMLEHYRITTMDTNKK